MFQRAGFKLQARQSLSHQFSKTLLVTFFILLVFFLLMLAEFFAATPLFTAIVACTEFLLSGPILLAALTYFLYLAKYEQANTNYFFTPFLSIGRAIPALLWQTLRIFLWSCLFIIPGIVKSYAYSQYFFILAEEPKINFEKALKTSEKITKGYKMELFMLDLSFIGWFILGSLTCGLAFFYVLPYYFLTKAHLYQYLKTEALKQNICTSEDFATDEIFTDHDDDNELWEARSKQAAPRKASNTVTPPSATGAQTPKAQAQTQTQASSELRKDDVRSLLEQISKDNPNLKEKIEAAKKEVDNKNKVAAESAVKQQASSVKPPTLDPSAIPQDILSHMETLNKMAGHEPQKSTPSKPQQTVKDIPGQPAYELYVFPAVEAMQREKAMRGEQNIYEENHQPTEFHIQPNPAKTSTASADADDEDGFTTASYEYIADPTKLQ